MSYDEIHALAIAAGDAVKQKQFLPSIEYLNQIIGQCDVFLRAEVIWETIQEEYEKGLSPKKLAAKYSDFTPKQITDKAHMHHWMSPKKLEKQYKPVKSRKANVFYLDCHDCEERFESASGSKRICDRCRALKNEPKGRVY